MRRSGPDIHQIWSSTRCSTVCPAPGLDGPSNGETRASIAGVVIAAFGFGGVIYSFLVRTLVARVPQPWLMAAGVGCGMTGPGLFTFPQTLAGPQAVGRWFGWQNGFANVAGVVGPSVTGFVVQRTGNFLAPFAITAAVCVAGGLAWLLIVRRVEQVRWAAS